MVSGNRAGEESLSDSANVVRRGGSRDNNRRDMGGRKSRRANSASSDQPRIGRGKLDDSKMPQRKARQIQKRGMRNEG